MKTFSLFEDLSIYSQSYGLSVSAFMSFLYSYKIGRVLPILG